MRWQRLLFIGVVLAAAIIGANWRLKDIVHPKAESIRKSIRYDEVTGKINILVVGEDDTGDSHRADSIAIATLDIEGDVYKRQQFGGPFLCDRTVECYTPRDGLIQP